MVAVDREGSSCGLHLVISCDVVLDEKRNAMARTTNLSSAAFVIELTSDSNCIGIYLDDGVQQRLKRLHASDVTLRQLPACQLGGSHQGLKLRNRGFNKLFVA